jgi:hypothetical protein
MHSTQQAIDDAQTVQNAWNDASPSPPSPQITPADSSPSSPSSSEAEEPNPTEPSSPPPSSSSSHPEEEEFGAFVFVPTDPFKKLIFSSHSYPDEDDTLELLGTNSTSIFVGRGIVAPVYASIDMQTRGLRRAGKLALRRLQIMREKGVLKPKAAMPAVPQEEAKESAKTVVQDKVVENEYIPRTPTAPVVSRHHMDGVVRPISFAKPKHGEGTGIEQMAEFERNIWGSRGFEMG